MLISFKLINFRSFLNAQTLSYIPAAGNAHQSTQVAPNASKAVPSLLRSAVLFGPNGSGKSNLVLGLKTFRDLVLHSHSFSSAEFQQLHTPFKLGPRSGIATEFSVDVVIRGVRYQYDVAYAADRIHWERLLVYQTGKSQRWYERRFDAAQQEEQWAPFSPTLHGSRQAWRNATSPTALFLTTAALYNAEQLRPLFDWFERDLKIDLPSTREIQADIGSQLGDPHFKARILDLLHTLDFRVEDLRVMERKVTADAQRATSLTGPWKSAAGAAPKIEFLHKGRDGSSAWLNRSFESAGVYRLLGLCCTIMAAINHERFLVIDEFGKNLHPLVTRFLFHFINESSDECRGQTLLVSHDVTLMDLDLLRRDEIWLIERDAADASVLSVVLQRRPRKNENLRKKYLRGVYGAVPSIRSH